MNEEKLLLRPEEAARALALSRARLYQLMATGELASVKIGASRRVPLVDLQGYVQRLRVGGEATPNGQHAEHRELSVA